MIMSNRKERNERKEEAGSGETRATWMQIAKLHAEVGAMNGCGFIESFGCLQKNPKLPKLDQIGWLRGRFGLKFAKRPVSS